mmetsp:Transcript_62368/g.195510  ORF Transcript_62368/g.195510 Transcript_62368/m.195510 type:complete len:222 (-) Transcript_62368:1127-1792(-)
MPVLRRWCLRQALPEPERPCVARQAIAQERPGEGSWCDRGPPEHDRQRVWHERNPAGVPGGEAGGARGGRADAPTARRRAPAPDAGPGSGVPPLGPREPARPHSECGRGHRSGRCPAALPACEFAAPAAGTLAAAAASPPDAASAAAAASHTACCRPSADAKAGSTHAPRSRRPQHDIQSPGGGVLGGWRAGRDNQGPAGGSRHKRTVDGGRHREDHHRCA